MPKESSKPSGVAKTNSYPTWCPRFWHGMRLKVWWGLLARNGFRVSPSRLHIALGVSIFTPFNELLALTQWLIYGRKIRDAKIESPPIFILGHWRSGTTLLHELLVTDKQFASPSTFQCFAPSHHLVSEWAFVRFLGFLLPKKRPMDNMSAGWDKPQEDEFALMNLGVPTPYLRIAFPRTQPKAIEYLSLRDLSPADLQYWKDGLSWFMRTLTVRHSGKRLVMKSPPHTGRIEELAKLYPGAKFIHLSRDPCKLFLSTIRLWNSLDNVQALQTSGTDQEMEDYVTQCLTQMYASFEAGRKTVAPECIADVRYEDLVAEPIETLRRLYSELDLGDFEAMQPDLAKRLEGHGSYTPNKHANDPELDKKILEKWADYARQYGYL